MPVAKQREELEYLPFLKEKNLSPRASLAQINLEPSAEQGCIRDTHIRVQTNMPTEPGTEQPAPTSVTCTLVLNSADDDKAF